MIALSWDNRKISSSSMQMTVNLKKLRTLTLRMCKRFRCKQCCCSVVLVLKTGLIRPATQGRGRYSMVPSMTGGQHGYLFSNLGTDGSTLEGIKSASLN